MATRVVEGKKPYTGGKAISIDENKVISLNLRDENNLIIYDEGDDEIYVDLQLPNEIEPTDAFPVGVTTGRVIVDNGWDLTGTIICAKTTSGDEIKLLYADEGTLWIDNGTGTFKQIYFKADVDLLISTLTTYINTELAKKQNGVASATAPSNPSEGDLWYDTTSDELKVYDGSQWNVAGGATYTAGKGIAILNGTDYSAMRGPCDEGYHVPSETEFNALITALTTLGLTLVDTTAQTYLLMPLAGMRARNDGSVSLQGTEGHYRSCDSASSNRAKRMLIDSYDIAVGGEPNAIGESIRPFKDEAVIPDSGRTTLYAGTGDAGIFHNSTDGIISISADGTTWMTIADKNLGATTVYNYGDTESQANCGYYYQWGNNYGFAWTGAVTTSSTQVDASSYGPSEYSSSTFITDSPRDDPRNHDLWGGVTGTTQNNNAIINLGVLVSDQANNIFTPGMKIWGGTQTDYQSLTPDSNTAYLLLADQPTPPSPGWQPGANTLYYYNIDDNDTTSTLYDKTGNYDMTWTGTPSFTNESGLGRVIVLDGTVYSTASSYVDYGDEYTFVCVVNGDGDFYCQGASLSRTADKGLYWTSNSITFRTGNNTGQDTLDCNSNPGYGKWSIYAFVGSSTGNYRKVYVDGTLVDSNTYYNSSQGGGDYGHIGIWRSGGAITQVFNGKMKSFLAENVAWTEQEIQDYCDMIQANYGIS